MEQHQSASSHSLLLSVPEVSHRLNVSERFIRGEIAAGRLVSVLLGRRRLVAEDDLRRYVEEHRVGGEVT